MLLLLYMFRSKATAFFIHAVGWPESRSQGRILKALLLKRDNQLVADGLNRAK